MSHFIDKVRWQLEHRFSLALPQTDSLEASGGIVHFYEWLAANWLSQQSSSRTSFTALDIGCGKGRNAIYLAKQGLKVTAFDFSRVAINRAKESARMLGQDDIEFYVHDATKKWPHERGSFDLVVNNFTLGDVGSGMERIIVANESTRVLRSGGLLGLHTLSVETEFWRAHQRESNALRILGLAVQYGHHFEEEEIRALFPALILREFTKRPTQITYLGKQFQATNYLNIFQKP